MATATFEYYQANRGRFLEGLTSLLKIPSISTLPEHKSDVRRAAELSRRWATWFCDAYEALIRLAALPARRDAVDRVADDCVIERLCNGVAHGSSVRRDRRLVVGTRQLPR